MKRYCISIISALAVLLLSVMPVMAQAPGYHEDPEQVRMVFNGLSLLRYYAGSLETVEQREPAETEARLRKMPFVNIPSNLEETTDSFASSGIELSASLAALWKIRENQVALLGQFRLEEVLALDQEIAGRLPQVNKVLNRLSSAVEVTGRYLKVDPSSGEGELNQAYREVMEIIQRLREMLEILERPLLDEETLSEIWGTANPGDWQKLMKPTELSLDITPQSAFVGEEIVLSGRLLSQGQPLADREIEILLEKSPVMVARTDSGGYYRSSLSLPYRYVDEMELQAVYYPQNKDRGVYLGTSSPAVNIKVLYYTSLLNAMLEGPAYPGKEAVISGVFDYGEDPAPTLREVEIYLDDVLNGKIMAGPVFKQSIKLADQLTVGKHTLTVSAPSMERYSPVLAGSVMNVTLAEVKLDIDLQGIAIIPGSMNIHGRAYSEAGPLAGASIKIQAGGDDVQVATLADGSFQAQIRKGVELSLLGYQDIDIQVFPQEPWNAPATAGQRVFVVNILSCGGLMLIVAVTGFYIPRRRSKRSASGKRVLIKHPVKTPETKEEDKLSGKPADQPWLKSGPTGAGMTLGYWYRLALKVVQRITRKMLKPDQTLREYVRETSPKLGPAVKPFRELTALMERCLYASWQPGQQDLEKGEKLSRQVEEEARK